MYLMFSVFPPTTVIIFIALLEGLFQLQSTVRPPTTVAVVLLSPHNFSISVKPLIKWINSQAL